MNRIVQISLLPALVLFLSLSGSCALFFRASQGELESFPWEKSAHFEPISPPDFSYAHILFDAPYPQSLSIWAQFLQYHGSIRRPDEAGHFLFSWGEEDVFSLGEEKFWCNEKGFFLECHEEEGEVRVVLSREEELHTQTFSVRDMEEKDPFIFASHELRWLGKDLFLKLYGGEMREEEGEKERLEFIQSKPPFSCYVGKGEALAWKEGRWQSCTLGEATRGLPLLCVEDIAEGEMLLKYYSSTGKRSIDFRLTKTPSPEPYIGLLQPCEFIGAKTWQSYIFSLGYQKLVLQEGEWLLYHANERCWKPLESAAILEEYVVGIQRGELFICNALHIERAHIFLEGHLFNEDRNKVVEICLEIPFQEGRRNNAYFAEEGTERQRILRLPKVVRGKRE